MTAHDYQTLAVSLEGGVLTVEMNRPDRMNAVNGAMTAELKRVFDFATADAGVRCLLLTGRGKAFCSGRDLADAKPGEDAYKIISETLNPMLAALYECPKPTLSAVNGVAMGVGLGLALACDIVYAADNARFSSPFARLGVALDSGGHFFLPRALGANRALELIYTADVIRGRQAEAWGLVNRSVPGSKLLEWTGALARRIADGPSIAFARQKALVRRSPGMSYAEILEAEARLQAELVTGPEYAEGLKAFREKRAPDFRSIRK